VWMFGNVRTCIFCVFVLFRLCIFILICFYCKECCNREKLREVNNNNNEEISVNFLLKFRKNDSTSIVLTNFQGTNI